MKRILIVEDEENVLKILSNSLREKNTEILSATNLEKALSAIDENLLDVVITDVNLNNNSKMQGFEVISHIRAVSAKTKIIVISGDESPEIVKQAYEMGASTFFSKPLDMRVLKQKLSEF